MNLRSSFSIIQRCLFFLNNFSFMLFLAVNCLFIQQITNWYLVIDLNSRSSSMLLTCFKTLQQRMSMYFNSFSLLSHNGDTCG